MMKKKKIETPKVRIEGVGRVHDSTPHRPQMDKRAYLKWAQRQPASIESWDAGDDDDECDEMMMMTMQMKMRIVEVSPVQKTTRRTRRRREKEVEADSEVAVMREMKKMTKTEQATEVEVGVEMVWMKAEATRVLLVAMMEKIIWMI